jgi:anaerobic selenocysteine-containing dehydrogenase
MNSKDMARLGLRENQEVRVTSYFKNECREIVGFKLVSYEIAEGCVAMYFPEANPLIPVDSVADKSLCPTSKLVKVKISALFHE